MSFLRAALAFCFIVVTTAACEPVVTCDPDDEVETQCGCTAGAGGSVGEACNTGDLCVVNGARATAATLADGVCGCPCDPGRGGTICAADVAADGGISCSCSRTDPVGTCEAASLDAAGVPHRPADTCSPDTSCVCFAAGRVCDSSENCTNAGCTSLVTDDNCGVADRACSAADTGIADGRCIDGGCACDVPADCRGTGLNVDNCGFDGNEVLRCLCDGYNNAGAPAACPMGLECLAAGCVFDGKPYATQAALITAIDAR